jgi:hypothetical protein
MIRVWHPFSNALAGLFVAAMCAFPQATVSAKPGALNYIEGHAFIDNQPVQQNQVGHLNLDANQTLRTDEQSKAEILLTPGVFLRVGPNSEVTMVTPSLTNTQVALNHGEALVDAAEVFKENNIQIIDAGASISLTKAGLYRFTTDQPTVSVFDGKATVHTGDDRIDVKKGRQVLLTSNKLKAEKFDRKQTGELYAWSNLRSQYAAETSYATARTIVVNNGWGGWGNGFGTGWYWNPFYSSWAFIPGSSYYTSPFGWGFYSPGYLPYASLYYAPGRLGPIPRGYGYGGGYSAFRGGRPGYGVVGRPGGRFPSGMRAAPPRVMAAPRMGGFSRGMAGGRR